MFSSFGFKRWLAAALSIVLGIAQVIPQASGVVTVVQNIAAFFGVTGLLHATAAGTVTLYALLSAQSVLTILVALSTYVSALLPYHDTLLKLSILLGTFTVGLKTKELLRHA